MGGVPTLSAFLSGARALPGEVSSLTGAPLLGPQWCRGLHECFLVLMLFQRVLSAPTVSFCYVPESYWARSSGAATSMVKHIVRVA